MAYYMCCFTSEFLLLVHNEYRIDAMLYVPLNPLETRDVSYLSKAAKAARVPRDQCKRALPEVRHENAASPMIDDLRNTSIGNEYFVLQ